MAESRSEVPQDWAERAEQDQCEKVPAERWRDRAAREQEPWPGYEGEGQLAWAARREQKKVVEEVLTPSRQASASRQHAVV